MGIINLTSWSLLIGALGQALFFGYLFPDFSDKAVFGFLAIPWFAVYAISFCRVAPCGPRAFRLILTIAMCWYAVVMVLAETLRLIMHPSPHGHYSLLLPRVLMYSGLLGCIVLARFCRVLRHHEASGNA